MDLNNHVILPQADFQELTLAAFQSAPKTIADRVASTTQTTIVTAVLVAGFTAACWGWAKSAAWRESYSAVLQKDNPDFKPPRTIFSD